MRLKSLAIEPTNRCNLSCAECYGRSTRPEGLMDMALFEKVVKEAQHIGVGSIGMHYGGEPTVHPEYPAMLRRVGFKHFSKVTFSTNGIGVSDEVVEAAVVAGIDIVNISVHTTSDEPADLARRFLVARKKVKSKRPRVTSNLMHEGLSPEQIRLIYDRYHGAVDSFGLTGTIRDMQWAHLPTGAVPVTKTHCHQPLRYLAVLWDGRLTICCRDLAGELAFGDVNQRSLVQELAAPIAVRRRTEIVAEGAPRDKLCRGCKLWQSGYRWAPYSPC